METITPLLGLVLLLPLVGAVLNGLIALAAARRRATPPEAIVSLIGVLAPFAAFGVAAKLFADQLGGAEDLRQVYSTQPWLVSGPLKLGLDFAIDRLGALMLMIVTGVGALIHLYSVGYMHGDKGYARYFSYLNLFTFAMLVLVTAANLPLLFVGWEGVGLCSFLLIAFWYEDANNAYAGTKAFVVNRVGDAAFLLGMAAIFTATDTLDFALLAANPAALAPVATLAAFLLLVGATGKSAQLPLMVWLPDAMAGPTSVSALIHAATMVTAGVYLVARLSFLFELAPVVLVVVSAVGAATALWAALIACAQNDIKKVLAYSTISQLGYMFLAAGAASYGAALFHVFTHAFFKALLFLGAGAVIHALHGEQDIRRMGLLRKDLPLVSALFGIGVLAIAGVPPLAGFWSKDAVLVAAWGAAGHQPLYWLLWAIALFTAGLTAFYMTRLFLVAFVLPRQEESTAPGGHPHAPGLTMTIPLVILALGSIGAGFLPVPGWLAGGEEHHAEGAAHTINAALGLVAALTGIAVSWLLYARAPERRQALKASFSGLVEHLRRKLYADEVYETLFVQPYRRLSEIAATQGEQYAVEGTLDAIPGLYGRLSRSLRPLQSGKIRRYAYLMLIGAAILFGYYVAMPSMWGA